jgi:DNA (cytosine-5)-methyltransferase 1
MRHGSLFSGIGGFDYAAQLMGWENVFHCEWNEFGQRVLKHYWPQAISYHDITKTDFTIHREGIEIISGGFPCQPYSTAGKRLGKDDERHLWPEMLRAIREIQPRWVVGENVFGLVNWNGGMVFEEVQADLESEGYEVQPFILPAAGVNAPHRRDRVWFVAYRNATNATGKGSGRELQQGQGQGQFRGCDCSGDATNANGNGLEGCVSPDFDKQPSNTSEYDAQHLRASTGSERISFEKFPTQPPLCSGDDGLPAELDGITFSKWRNESIKAAGNAIVPQVALQIFKAIEQYEHTISVTPTKR